MCHERTGLSVSTAASKSTQQDTSCSRVDSLLLHNSRDRLDRATGIFDVLGSLAVALLIPHAQLRLLLDKEVSCLALCGTDALRHCTRGDLRTHVRRQVLHGCAVFGTQNATSGTWSASAINLGWSRIAWSMPPYSKSVMHFLQSLGGPACNKPDCHCRGES
jgi:hypothetical protein